MILRVHMARQVAGSTLPVGLRCLLTWNWWTTRAVWASHLPVTRMPQPRAGGSPVPGARCPRRRAPWPPPRHQRVLPLERQPGDDAQVDGVLAAAPADQLRGVHDG